MLGYSVALVEGAVSLQTFCRKDVPSARLAVRVGYAPSEALALAPYARTAARHLMAFSPPAIACGTAFFIAISAFGGDT